MYRLLTIVLAASFMGQFASAQGAVIINEPEIHQHIIFVQDILRIRTDVPDGWTSISVGLAMTVGIDGSVLSAIPMGACDSTYCQQASQGALQCRFRPFERNGKPGQATFPFFVAIVPPDRRPAERTGFPEIVDWNSLRMTLERTRCSAKCPSYTLEVRGDGSVHYDGDHDTNYYGEWSGTVSQSTVRELFSNFRGADYFWLFRGYVEDHANAFPMYRTSISYDKNKMSVEELRGEYVGLPTSVRDLEDAIDRLAGPEHWVTRTKVHPEVDVPCSSPGGLVPTVD